jgi:hypothetical protein
MFVGSTRKDSIFFVAGLFLKAQLFYFIYLLTVYLTTLSVFGNTEGSSRGRI